MKQVDVKDSERGVHLVYQYFQVQASADFDGKQTAERQAEYQDCLFRNVLHKQVAKVHLLIENVGDEKEVERFLVRLNTNQNLRSKVEPIWLGRRMTYRDAFEYCNDQLANKVVAVMNADIFMGLGIDQLLKERDRIFLSQASTSASHDTIEKGVVLSLTRHEPSLCEHYATETSSKQNTSGSSSVSTVYDSHGWCGCPFLKGRRYYGSHDSFWFVPPLSTSVLEQCDHIQNRWGAEHKVLNALIHEGYRVFNPSISVVTYHHHATDIHPWRKEQGGDKVLADPRDHEPLPPVELADIIQQQAGTRI